MRNNIDSLTIDAGFGLGDIDEAKPLLTKGIQFCDIQKGNLAITQEVTNSSYLNAWEDIQILVKCKSPEQLKTIKASKDAAEDAILIKIDLMKMVQENAVYSKDEIRKMQGFFIDAGKPYLSRAYNLMRRRERSTFVNMEMR